MIAIPQSVSRKTRFRVSACMLFLALFQVATLAVGMKFALAGFADFRAFYGAGTIVRTGQAADLYDYELQHRVQNAVIGGRTAALPFVYPTYAALPFVPLSLLHYKAAFVALLLINAALLAAAVLVMLPYLEPLRAVWPPLPWLLFACFYPVGIALLQGQVSMALLLIFCLCFVSLERGRTFSAGALLAVGLMKFHVVLPIVLLFAIWRRWRFVGGFALGSAAVGLVCLVMAGAGGLKNYVHAMTTAAATGAVGAPQDGYQVFSAKMPNLHGLAFALAGQARWGAVLLALASVAVLVWTALQPPSLPRAVIAALLVSYHLHLHDLSLLLLPLGLILSEGCAAWLRDETPADRRALGTALFWMAAPVLAWMSGAGLNSVMALAMLPLLLSTAGRNPESGMLNP